MILCLSKESYSTLCNFVTRGSKPVVFSYPITCLYEWFSCFIYVMYVYRCPTLFPYHMSSTRTGVTGGAGIVTSFGSPRCIPRFEVGSSCSIVSCLCSALLIIVSTFSLGRCIIYLWFTDSDYVWCLQTFLVTHSWFHRHLLSINKNIITYYMRL